MKLVPLSNVKDDDIFWLGTRFRVYNIGLNVKNKNDDYYEYMLAEIPGEREFMLLTNVSGHKSGCALALVKTIEDRTKFVVSGHALKYSMGTENVFLLSVE